MSTCGNSTSEMTLTMSEEYYLDSQTRIDLPGGWRWLMAQDRPTFRVKVDMVVLSFQITDSKGHYVNGLKPKDFRILEDGIPQKIVTFAEATSRRGVAADGTMKPVADAGRGRRSRYAGGAR